LNLEPLEDRWVLSSFGSVPDVTYHGGPLLQNVQIESVYYGQPWTTDATLQQSISQTDGFLQYFVTSPYINVLSQYNVGAGTFLAHDVVNQGPANQTIDDSQVRQVLDSEITSGHVAAPGSNSLYVFFTPPGVVVTADGQSSAKDFSGYHDVFTDSAGATVYYAVVPYPNGSVANERLSAFQQTTVVLSHEVSEAMTDPDTQTGWFDPQLGEIGDIGEGQLGLLHGYVVQGIWSQSAGQVVVPSDSGTTTSSVQVNAAPVKATAGQAFTSIVATITGGPAGATYTATIDWGNGTTSDGSVTADPNGGFDVIGTNTYSQAGSFPITVTVKDSTGTVVGTALGKATVTAAASNLHATGVVLTATAGQSFTGTVATFTDTNTSAMAGNFTATIDWGDGTTSTGTVAADPNGGFDVTGTHTYSADEPDGLLDHDQTGTTHFLIRVVITDSTTSAQATALGLATVAAPPPVITVRGDNIAAVAGQSFTGTVATFTDTNTSAMAGNFTATIDWGDGTTSTGTVTADPNGGFDVTGTHTYSTDDWFGLFDAFRHGGERFLIHVGITDTTTQDQGTALAVASVAPEAANLTVVVQNISGTFGQSFSGVVATFTDVHTSLGASDFTATIYWGDGTSSTGVIATDPNGGFDVTGTHTYSSDSDSGPFWGGPGFAFGPGLGEGRDNGVFPLAVVVHDTTSSDFGVGVGFATVTPAASNVQATGVVVNAVLGQSFTGTVATFTVPGNSATNLTATINWGDGTTSTGTIVANSSGGFNVVGTHTYGDGDDSHSGYEPSGRFFLGGDHSGPFPFLVSVTITDSTTAAATTVLSLANVTTAPPSLVASSVNLNASAGTAFTGTVATFTDTDGAPASSYRATIAWGDGTVTDGTITANGAGGFLVGGTHTYQEDSIYRVLVHIHDTDGNSAVSLGTATVGDSTLLNNLTPVVLALVESAEHFGDVIIADYQQFVGRTPSSAEVAAWVTAMQHGTTEAQVQAGFLGAVETYVHAGNTPKGWVDSLYRTLLGRTADAAGESAWAGVLAHGATRYAIALGIATSAERESILVRGYYQQYEGRSASGAEVSAWVNAFEHGTSNNQIVATFLGSPEYFQAQHSNVTDWLFSTYQAVLSRQPDQAGLNGWLAMLSPGQQ
jgi:hypothetical protein